MSDILDRLLKPEIPNVQKDLPTAKYKIKRLSKIGEDIVFTIQALPYGKVTELKEGLGGDMNPHIVLEGVVEPDLKDLRFAQKFGGVTPIETIKAMLLPGEIEDIARAVERLCGYRTMTIEEVKND